MQCTFTDELLKEYGTLYTRPAPRTLNRVRQIKLCSRCVSSTRWRFSTKTGLETQTREELRGVLCWMSLLKPRIWLEKLAIKRMSVFCRSWLVPRSTRSMPTFKSCRKDQLSIKLSNFSNQSRARYSSTYCLPESKHSNYKNAELRKMHIKVLKV